MDMKIQVFDTYVKNEKDETMHFDVFMPEGKTNLDAISAATAYLSATEHGPITSTECKFCHIQDAKTEQEEEINKNGYFIYKMSPTCP